MAAGILIFITSQKIEKNLDNSWQFLNTTFTALATSDSCKFFIFCTKCKKAKNRIFGRPAYKKCNELIFK